MGLVTKKELVCDRCGASIEVDEGFHSLSLADLPDGWQRVDHDRVLCPECYPGYDLLKVRHKVELEDYISNAS